MTYVLGGIENDQIQQSFVFPLSSKIQWDQVKIIHNTVGRSRRVPLTRRFNNYQTKADELIDGIASELRQLASITADIRPNLQPKDTNLALVLLDSVDFGSVCNGRGIARR